MSYNVVSLHYQSNQNDCNSNTKVIINFKNPKDMKKYMEELISEYNQVKGMTEQEVQREYEDTKANVLADYEREIDWYEHKIYGYAG